LGKIVVTGYGVKAPKTNNIEQFLSNLRKGVCCLESINHLSPNGEDTIIGRINGSLQEFETDKRFKRYPRVTLLGMSAGKEALDKADLSNFSDKKVGVFIGTSLGAMGEMAFQESIVQIHR
jgi:3-oxoacyl-(acyl-carrier-protein) synthase